MSVLVALLVPSLALVPSPHTDALGGSLVLNEFMAHPTASATQAEGEWLEIYNASGGWINLSGWRVRNLMGDEIVLCSYLLPPQGYVVLGACGSASRNGGYEPDIVYSGFTMEDSGGLILLAPGGTEADRVDYDSSWPVEPGASTEKINPGWASSLASSWACSVETYGSGDKGTPGSENSVYQNSFGQNTWAFIKAFVQ